MKWLAALPLELLRAAALLLAFGCVVAGLAAWGGGRSPRLDVLTHFAPMAAAACAVAGLIGLAARGPGALRSTGPVALIGLVIWLGLMTPELVSVLTQKKSAPAAETLKIVQFNLWVHDDDHASEKLAWLRQQDPDVIVLEEVNPAAAPILAGLAKSHPHRSGCEGLTTCSGLIISKRPSVRAGRLPDSELAGSWASFRTGLGEFTVVGVHMTWPIYDDLQRRQFSWLARELARFDNTSLILTGDFNATPWSFTLREFDKLSGLARRTRAMATWPAADYSPFRLKLPFPVMPIDQVYAGGQWRTVRVERGPSLGSDHRPVVVVLTRDAA